MLAFLSLAFMPFSFSSGSALGDMGAQYGDIIFILLFLMLILTHLTNGIFIPSSILIRRFFLLYIIFLIYAAWTLIWSPSFAWLRSIQHFYVLLVCFVLYLCLKKCNIESLVRYMAAVTALIAWASCIGGTFEYLSGSFSSFVEEVSGRLVGTFREPNQLTIFLVPMSVLVFYEALHSRGVVRIFWFFSFLVCVFDIALSGSDGGVLILLISIVFFSFTFIKKSFVLMGLAVLFFLCFFSYADLDHDDIKGALNVVSSLSGLFAADDVLHSLGGHRIDMWEEASALLSDRLTSLLFGFGEGSFPEISKENSLHNTYMNILFSFGLVGVVLFVLLSLAVAVMIARIKVSHYRHLMTVAVGALFLLGAGHWVMKSRVLMLLLPLLLVCYQQCGARYERTG